MQEYTSQAIRLDTVHGYRLDGDNVELNAQVVLNEGASLSNWKLQLWANDVLTNGGPGGIKVAEVDLEQARVSAGVAQIATRVDALLPPSGRFYDMALVLARGDAEAPLEVANYSERQWISGPFLQGAVGYAVLTDGNVSVTVEQVCNPRAANNTSGTLALELWAVSEQYVGGVVRGHQLAGVELGTVGGQTSRTDVAATVAFVEPPAGQWQIVLMLREWTAAGYVTRDYRTFDARYSVVAAPANDVKVTETARASVAAQALDVVEAAVQPGARAYAQATASAAPCSAQAIAVAANAKQPLDVTRGRSESSPSADRRVSVQTAPIEELMGVKGISKKVAQEIVRARPFKSLDELKRIKGIGDKTLRALRGAIKL